MTKINGRATNEDAHFHVLRELNTNPALSQRELAAKLGISLGKTNYCLKTLVERGWVKAGNVRNRKNGFGYTYQLTPEGLDQKARLSMRFLQRKRVEYEALKKEIAELSQEIE